MIISIKVPCINCNESVIIEAEEKGIRKWQEGMLIQTALPELTAEQREMLISRICPDCWNRMFPPEEEE